VRHKIIESGAVDVQISIRSNFFYKRTVPCELWFFDRGKSTERSERMLMLDARYIYRKVSRKINDFSREQLQNLTAAKPHRHRLAVSRAIGTLPGPGGRVSGGGGPGVRGRRRETVAIPGDLEGIASAARFTAA
jgi:hypothetical protein